MPSNNPVSKKEEARLVKHPGKRDRLVCATPPKPELMLLSRTKTIEPKPTLKFGLDGFWRIWDSNGHLIKWGETETVSADKWQSYVDGLMSGIQ